MWIKDIPLLDAIAAASMTRCGLFTMQGLSNTAWALARLEFDDMPFLHAIASAAIPRLANEDIEAQNIANLAWAFAKLNVHIVPLMDALSSESIKRIDEFKPLELPITFWAFATLLVVDEPLCEAISAAAIPMCSQLQMLDLSNTAWSLAFLGKTNQPLLEAIAARARTLIDEANGNPQSQLGNPVALLWAFWRLHQDRLEPQLFNEFADLGILIELISSGNILMGNDWRKIQPVEVKLEEAMQVVCFWTQDASS